MASSGVLNVPVLADVAVILLSSVAVLTPYGQYLDCATVAFRERYNIRADRE
jgi:hypothetical protein